MAKAFELQGIIDEQVFSELYGAMMGGNDNKMELQ
jgi:hypothetical protein